MIISLVEIHIAGDRSAAPGASSDHGAASVSILL
jgi:hypothetical protein